MSNVHKLLRLVSVVLPQPLKRALFRHVLGWNVARDAYVGLSYIGADAVTLGPGSRIGHFNIVRNVQILDVGARAYIKDFNHIFGCTPEGMYGERAFRVGDDAHIMSRHFFEVGGAITLGDRVTVAGRGTQIYSHTLVTPQGFHEWKVGDVVIGDGAKVFAGAILILCHVPQDAIVAAGAVLTKSYEPEPEQRLLIAGNPAVIVGRRAIASQPLAQDVSSASV
jgi:acetyltransferase-like isoleucine patch superfamily enzyme